MDELDDVVVPLRRDLHRRPEIGLQLPYTQEQVLKALDGLPLEIALGRNCSSITAVLRGGSPGPTVLLRADMDALPVDERTGLEFASTNGAMHACGHDLHTAMLVGAAHVLAGQRDGLAGDVVLAFQPGEEGCDGAARMLAEGLLTASGSRPTAAFAIHVTSAMLPGGVVAGRGGPLLAAVDTLTVTVLGAGGHGSAPHAANDPMPAAAAMVGALQTAVTREFDIFDPVVVTVGKVHAGSAPNIIPATARLEATVRSFSETAHDKLAVVLPRVCKGIAAAYGVEVQVELTPLYPVTVNDADKAAWAMQRAEDLLGPERVVQLPHPMAGAEDFSRVLAEVPGAMVMLGATPPGADPAAAPYNHAPEADFDERVLSDGARLYASLAAGQLS